MCHPIGRAHQAYCTVLGGSSPLVVSQGRYWEEMIEQLRAQGPGDTGDSFEVVVAIVWWLCYMAMVPIALLVCANLAAITIDEVRCCSRILGGGLVYSCSPYHARRPRYCASTRRP